MTEYYGEDKSYECDYCNNSLNDTDAENNKTITGLTFQVKELTELKTKIVMFFKTL